MANYYSYNTNQVQADINMDNAIKDIQNQLLNIPTDTQLGLKANQTDLDTTNANVAANTSSLAEKATQAFITPEDYGAKGDGSTNDSTALNNAISYASTNKRSVKFMSGKTYRVKNITLPANTTLEGNGAILKLTDDASKDNNDKLLISYSSHVTVKDLTLDGNIGIVAGSPQYGCNLFYTIGTTYLTVENVIFQNSAYSGITIGDADKVRINGCKFMNIDAGIISNSNFCYNVSITNNHFDGHGESEPITIMGDTLNQNIVITGNTILNKVSGLGIIVGEQPVYDPDNTSRSYKVVIAGNVIDGASTGIQLNNVTGANVYGNTIKNTGNHGISLSKLSVDIDIHDNLIDTVGLSCIDFSGATSGNVKIHHNTLKNPNNSGNANGTYSFLFTGATAINVANIWFENNNLYGGSHGTNIQPYINGTLRFNENEYISYTTEPITFNFQTGNILFATRNTNVNFVGTAVSTNKIDNGYLSGNGTNMDTSIHFFSRQGFDTVFIDNTQSTSSASLNTISTQYDGKKITLIIKKPSANTCAIDNTGNLKLQSASYALVNYSTCIFNFVCYGGNWYETNHIFI